MENARPAFVSIPGWVAMSGMSRTSTYYALGRGDLRAVKQGKRVLIDVEHGLAWLRALPAAKINHVAPPSRAA